jgi:hypothetical protein
MPKAETILELYTKAMGGKAAYDKIRNRVTKAHMEFKAQGIKLKMTIYAAKPNKLYGVAESDDFGKIERGTNGKVAWEDSMMSGPVIKKGVEKRAFLREAALDRFVYWRQFFEKAECTGKETVEGKECFKVVMTSKVKKKKAEGDEPEEKLKPITVFFDKESHRIVKMVTLNKTPMGEFPFEYYLEDFREIDGILIHHKLTN